MKKNLIALAVTAAVIAPTMAMAEVTVYGLAQVELTSNDPETTGAESYLNVKDNANGRVGVKASEDLGNGWQGIAKFEYKADTADGAADTATKGTGTTTIGLTPRETMVGLKGKGFGTIMLGRLKSPYKYAGGVKYDPFVATSLEARGNGGMSGGAYGHGGFLSNMVGYNGKFGPVKLSIVYGPSENDGTLGASATFAQKSWEIFVSLIDRGDSGAGLVGTGTALPTTAYSTYSSTKLGGKVTIAGMHTIVAQYEMTDPSTNGTSGNAEPKYLMVGYHAKVGKNMFVGEIGQLDADTTNGAGDTSMIVLGAIHKMSKTTRLFAGYRDTSVDITENGDTVITIGMRKDFK
jgi:predicted porin